MTNPEDMETSQQNEGIYTQLLQGPEALSALCKDWDDLFERSLDAPPYLSRAWANTFIDEARLRGTPLFIVVWSAEKLVALFPLAIRHFLGVKIAEPIGTGQPSYLGLLIDPNYTSVIGCIAKLFSQKKVADVVCIEDLSSKDNTTGALLAELSRNEFLCRRVYRNPCYWIRLGSSYDEYMKKTKTSRRRKKLRYEEKQLLKAGRVELERYIGEEITLEVLKRIARIQEKSWMKRRGAAVLGQVFYQKLLMEMAQAGHGHVWLMKINDSDAAFVYSLIAHGKLHYAWTAFKLEYVSSLSVGKVLTSWVIRDACTDGILSFDFGHGESEYKRFWANECHHVHRVVAGQGFGGRLIAIYYFVIWRLAKVRWLHSLCRHVRRRMRIFKQKVNQNS